MPKCVWPLLVTCVCMIVAAQSPVEIPMPSDIPMSDVARGIAPNRFPPTPADEIRALLPLPPSPLTPRPQPAPFELLPIAPPRHLASGNLVFAPALRHRVPKSAEKAFGRGMEALGRGKYDDAVKQLRKAVEIDDAYALAHANLGVALVRQQRLEEAEPEIRRAIALDPYMLNAHSNLAWVLAGLGRADEAEQMARRAIEIDPGNRSAKMLLDLRR